MAFVKIIWIIIKNLPLIITIIKELLILLSSLTGDPEKDERDQVKAVKRTAVELANRTSIPCPTALVRDL